jgi:D-arabinose 1-dehydrogenase-like Zn-dependent alcohol dehydrogenase
MSARVRGYAARLAGCPLEPMSWPAPELGEHDVRVAVSHCGLCFTDVQGIDDFYAITTYPFVPGHEIVGHVEARGGAVSELEVGDRVGIGWQGRSCGRCRWCEQGQVHLCYGIASMGTWQRHGGFADSVTVDAGFAYPLPAGIPSPDAAVLMCAGISVYAPLKRYAGDGRRAAIYGLGGLGHLAVQFAHALGYEVTALSSSEAKADEARRFGADHFIATGDRDRLGQLEFEFDLVLCTAHGGVDWQVMIDLLEKRGRLVLVGFPEVSMWSRDVVSHEISITGSFIGNQTTMREMLAFAQAHGIRPMIEVLPMAEVNDAIHRLREGGVRYRIVLTAET